MDAPGLLSAIHEFMGANGKDDRFKGAIESLGGVVDSLKPDEKTSPGKLAAKLAASEAADKPAPEPAKEGDKAPEAGASPKSFAEAKAAALELVGR